MCVSGIISGAGHESGTRRGASDQVIRSSKLALGIAYWAKVLNSNMCGYLMNVLYSAFYPPLFVIAGGVFYPVNLSKSMY